MHTGFFIGIAILVLAVVVALGIFFWKSSWRWGVAVAAAIAIIGGGIATYANTRPLEISADNGQDVIAGFQINRGKGAFQGSSFAFSTPMSEAAVFNAFQEEFPGAVLEDDRATSMFNGEEVYLDREGEADETYYVFGFTDYHNG